MRIALKSLAVVVVSFVTWMATSTILAQMARNAPNIPTFTGTVSAGTVVGHTQTPKPQHGAGTVAAMSMPQFEVVATDGMAIVTAQADMFDRRPGMAYAWRLRVISPGPSTFAKFVYDKQVFGMEDDGQMESQFTDSIVVPPGKSLVELSLYAFSKGTNLKFLDDEKNAEGYLAVRSSKEIESK